MESNRRHDLETERGKTNFDIRSFDLIVSYCSIFLLIFFFFILELTFVPLIQLQVGLAVVNGQLYAVGGFDGAAYLKTIEVYDPEQNQWRLCGCMNYRRLGGGVGVMRAPQTENYIW